jgi:hypothetical protein
MSKSSCPSSFVQPVQGACVHQLHIVEDSRGGCEHRERECGVGVGVEGEGHT